MSSVIETLQTFPLERPLLRGRQRETVTDYLLPYFIAGDENRLAYFVCQHESSLFEMGNPVLLIGNAGAGKTAIAIHLAAKAAALRNVSDDINAVKYLPAIDFARLYADAVNADDIAPMRQEIDTTPILVIDDLHLINNKAPAQEELASRVEVRTRQALPTILTCRRLPSEVRGLQPMLISRSLPGLTVPIQFPLAPTRSLILSELANKHSVLLDNRLIETLSNALGDRASVRMMSGVIKQIDLWCRMNDSSPCKSAIDAAMHDIQPEGAVPIARIAQAIARAMGLKINDLRSSSRKQSIVRARSLAMMMARQITGKSLNQIGEYFGGRDHSTVLHAIRKTESSLHNDGELSQVARDVTEKLNLVC